MMLGYSDVHSSKVYRMLNLETERVILTRDIIWLNKYWGIYKGLTGLTTTEIVDHVVDDAETPNVMTGTNDAQEEVPEPEPIQQEQTHQYATRSRGVHNIDVNQTDNPRVERELRQLDTYYNPTTSTHDDDEPPEAAEIALLS
eukprot:scaffold9820_cov84-Amphora_coffeaeformis.AAC.1